MDRMAARRRFFRRALVVIVLGQLPGFYVLFRALEALAMPSKGEILLGVAAWSAAGLMSYLLYGFPERPIPPWIRALLVYPFFSWFFICATALFPGLGLLLLDATLGAIAYSPPAHLQQLLNLSIVTGLAASIVITAYAVGIRRSWVVTRHVDVPIEGLPAALDGFRIVQFSDIHVGNFTPPERIARWVKRANDLAPDLTVITGDLINSGDAWTGELAQTLGGLRARHGVVVSLGNHDYWADVEGLIDKLRGQGVEVLRNAGRLLDHSGSPLFLGATDDLWTGRARVDDALASRPPGIPSILLAHDPALFPQSAARGVSLTLSGHTHGGQLAVPFLSQLNLSARVYRHHAGLYREGKSWIYVHRGMGTTGPPLRLGAAPELAVLRLRSA